MCSHSATKNTVPFSSVYDVPTPGPGPLKYPQRTGSKMLCNDSALKDLPFVTFHTPECTGSEVARNNAFEMPRMDLGHLRSRRLRELWIVGLWLCSCGINGSKLFRSFEFISEGSNAAGMQNPEATCLDSSYLLSSKAETRYTFSSETEIIVSRKKCKVS